MRPAFVVAAVFVFIYSVVGVHAWAQVRFSGRHPCGRQVLYPRGDPALGGRLPQYCDVTLQTRGAP